MPGTEPAVLPKNIKPLHYQIELKPDIENFTFAGNETIDVSISESSSNITLNSLDIDIQSASITVGGSVLKTETITYNKESETCTLAFAQEIPIGNGEIHIAFSGILNDKLRGFYRSQYIDPEGNTQYLATTQFEATDARQAFPCWDEPECKATFSVTLVVPSELVALANTPEIENTELPNGLKSVQFAKTPIMSTYLLAFVVGDLTHIEKEAASGTIVGVWTTRGKQDQGRFALDTSVKLLSFFNDYFGIPYPLEKLDHIAIPDFAAGAMENWGAVTYRETALLVDPLNSSAGTRQRVAEVVAHEMAHMWFGDLVTMKWWDDLWLNESFASWMGTKAVDWLFPEWEMWTQFVNMDTNRALSLDGLKNSHPIEQEVENPAEVSQLFDAISYSKGASVIRMLEQFLSPEVFRQGLHKYLSANKYQNAQTVDLWDALEEVSRQPVTEIMNTWTSQMGYPVVSVTSETSNKGLTLKLSQERFVYDNILSEETATKMQWQVPVRVLVPEDDKPSGISIISEPNSSVTLPNVSGQPSWFKLNPEQTGFFRVNYTSKDWQNLIPGIEAHLLSATDRLGIQNDAYALSKAGLLPVTQFLSLANAYKSESDASVWSDLASNLKEIETLISDEGFYGAYKTFARDLFKNAAQEIGWTPKTGEGHLEALLRSTVLSQAGNYGDTQVLNEAKSLFNKYLQDTSTVHPDLRGLVYSLVAQSGDRTTYDALWTLERSSELQEEKIRLLISLARFSDIDLLRDLLARSLTDDVRSQDTITLVSAVAANIKGRAIAWEFVKDNWTEFDKRYGGGGFGLMRLVAITGSFTSEEKASEIEEFFKEHPTPAAERTIRQSLERIRINTAWLGKNRDELSKWFN